MRFAEAVGMTRPALGGAGEATAIGIEFEVEGGDRYQTAGRPPIARFDIKHDGSLRGVAFEFVSSVMSRAVAETAVPAFCAVAREYQFTYSTRTSTHIHVNVRDITCEAVALMVVAAAALECSLYRMCDVSRRINQFCVPLSQQATISSFVSGIVHDLPQYLRRPPHVRTQKPAIGKYSALSTHRLYDYGTLEYRVLHGTNDEVRVLLMIDALLAIKQWAVHSSAEEAAGLLLGKYSDIEDVIFGENLARRIRAASLGGALPSSEKDCVDIARAALLATKMNDSAGMQYPYDVREADGVPPMPARIREFTREYVGMPGIGSDMRRLLRGIKPGDTRFGFTRRQDDDTVYEHTLLVPYEPENSTWAMLASYKIAADTRADEVAFEIGV